MHFSHQPYTPGETVAAVATPPGEGGVAIIRISGKNALSVADKVFSRSVKNLQSHKAYYGHIINEKHEHIDDVLLLPMLGKKSFTGEDTVEIHCHGGSLITRQVLDVVLNAGARSALPGEFSFKAFMNGKIDLAQAEAIQELICAKNERALSAAENQLQGRLSQKISFFQKELTEIAAILEAWVDFPEEGLEFASIEEICQKLENLSFHIQELIDTYDQGRIIHDGIALCLVGCPNVGKSSLMNTLLDKNRAIVSHIPGTTRDVLEDHMRLNGMNFRLIDTAGIREAKEEIEKEGIRRTHSAIQESDLILLLLDASREINDQEKELILKLPKEKTIVVWNKIDLTSHYICDLALKHTVHISAQEKLGLEALFQQIEKVIWNFAPPSKEEILITNVRHLEALISAKKACLEVIKGLKNGLSAEFVTLDMRECLYELGKILGTDISEDILSSIFSKFCIGK